MTPIHDESQVHLASIVRELRHATDELRSRGLRKAAKFVSELLIGIPLAERRQVAFAPPPQSQPPYDQSQQLDLDTRELYEASKSCFDLGEYLHACDLLRQVPCSCPKPFFLRCFARFLAGEKVKEEQGLEFGGTNTSTDPQESVAMRSGTNPHLQELHTLLQKAHLAQELDGFGLYLWAVVRKRLGTHPQVQESAPVASEEVSDDHASTRALLIESIALYPWNWSAWMELSAISPFISQDEKEVLQRACSWMFDLFQVHVFINQHQNEAARVVLDRLSQIFPDSTHLLAQKALASYDERDFDQAHQQFDQLVAVDPFRIEQMDVYSNVLYVKEDKPELSRLAHRALQVEKYCPETCCIVGNYYSLKAKHDRAIVYFHRALRLDPTFLAAWTLIGHEYIEMKNTAAAIEAYRHAVDLDPRDYRAWYGLGQAYEILNMFLYSIYYYRKAAAIRPYDARMWCALGSCYEKLQKINEAIACFKRAVGNQDQEGMASLHLGRMFAGRNELDQAAFYYQLHLGLVDAHDKPRPPEQETWDLDDSKLAHMRVGSNPATHHAILFLATFFKQKKRFSHAARLCNRLLDLQGPHKEEAKALLRELRSLETTHQSILPRSSTRTTDAF